MVSTAQESRDWSLFVDWCASTDADPIPASTTTVSGFLEAFPAPIDAQGRRVRAIRKAHERAGAPLALPTSQWPSVMREGARWAPLPRALAQLPTFQHRKNFQTALRARRDGWLLVLTGVVGLSRHQAREIVQQDVVLFPQLAIKGIPIPKTDPAAECPACAVTRWLRVAGAASFGWWIEIKELVSPEGVDEALHDCLVGLDGAWRTATTLLPAIDRHGWVAGDPMSTRAISSTMAYRQSLGTVAEISRRAPTVVTGRFANATMNELADAYDDVDQRAAALLLRLNEIVGETDDLLSHLKSFDL